MNPNRNRAQTNVVLLAVVMLLACAFPLKAYADPGSGLLIWQISSAILVGAMYHFRRFIVKVISLIRKKDN